MGRGDGVGERNRDLEESIEREALLREQLGVGEDAFELAEHIARQMVA